MGMYQVVHVNAPLYITMRYKSVCVVYCVSECEGLTSILVLLRGLTTLLNYPLLLRSTHYVFPLLVSHSIVIVTHYRIYIYCNYSFI